ncbi:YceI family protein [Gemmobacter caeruleus]|uniref:YceI family protein n=1 Tax=Gemmobacter caeruleus TaxID=2595004 RepID=UPI001396A9CF|nr:YceI family protein [Gemmobacter caeruleus]
MPRLPSLASWIVALALLPGLAPAGPRQYDLLAETSSVRFQTSLNGAPLRGSFAIRAAHVVLDMAHLPGSSVEVTLDVAGARTGLPFATEAMRGAEVLDVRHFPEARFRSTAIRAARGGARISGLLTLRGVTRPLDLRAEILRQHGQPEGDLSRLVVHLTGTLSRAAFGATGFRDMVGDAVALDITVRIAAHGG